MVIKKYYKPLRRNSIMDAVIVKKSKIHGRGAFANRDFKKGEVVIKYTLKSLTEEEFKSLPKSEKHFTAKRSEGGYWLYSSPERYVNHSCEPNTSPLNRCDVAIKDIRNGEEITTDYRKDNVHSLNMVCKCGSKICRKVIKNN